MKSVFITFDQSHTEPVIAILDHLNCRGFTLFDKIQGRGTYKGEPHLGSHAWPALCSGVITIVEDKAVEPLLKELKELDKEAEQLGLRAFVWNIEQCI